jgi:hypothetical protein
MKGVGTTIKSVDDMMAVLGSVRRELNELSDYLVAEGDALGKRIVVQIQTEGEIAFVSVAGHNANDAGRVVNSRMRHTAATIAIVLDRFELAADALVKTVDAIKAARAKQHNGRDALRI